MQDQKEQQLEKKGRVVAIVIAGAMLLWMAVQWIGQAAGLPGRFAILFDFAAIAALIWALVNVYQIWRARREMQG
ncbi:DUF5337 domain-containing protein [Shimia thalassica]|jgi:membrane protein implicated in regulation of membrane protease activity|uniref:DUF5337 domain-containing protein n=1 Tax=Shimia thalassica TaxID=1715693 RepID=A0A0P1I9N3_9RHOB|nr:DUF5337 domain-containing protein [Shimia thalassica]PHO02427.1 hypothetical protein CSC82_17970 [Rhodobacteraceae bacterium 4F10]MBU2944108.1 DUF5337 domain-containing protein [Shimia thalassica]MDO6483296.1 DUF5337 domain-containing protein [Shimia thalassica]MDO6503621.1 DUF5337 domain-containing protein [Shimia thalassica]MDO6520972.1 DUF5337 domain-containing protein [Shimia thalassica]